MRHTQENVNLLSVQPMIENRNNDDAFVRTGDSCLIRFLPIQWTHILLQKIVSFKLGRFHDVSDVWELIRMALGRVMDSLSFHAIQGRQGHIYLPFFPFVLSVIFHRQLCWFILSTLLVKACRTPLTPQALFFHPLLFQPNFSWTSTTCWRFCLVELSACC